MKAIINVERKRVLNLKTLILFIAIILIYSASGSYYSLKNYDIRDNTGVAISGYENLNYGKKEMKGKYLNEDYFDSLINITRPYTYIDEMNIDALIEMNYGRIAVEELTVAEIEGFYSTRLARIKAMLDENTNMNFTTEEKVEFMNKAKQLSLPLPLGYCEGWKVLNEGLEKFLPLLLILSAVILLPLFGSEPHIKMKELYRSTKNGKKKLDRGKIIAAYQIGSLLYIVGITLFFISKILLFGFEGGGQPIQSNVVTFFSLYHVTNLQQFLINVSIGLVAMIFTISFVLMITVLTEGIMTGAVIVIFFWILLLSFDQMRLYQVNHFFANFMPLRMTKFSHYYIGNELYRIAGHSMSCMKWAMMVSIMLSISMTALSVLFSDLKRDNNRLRGLLRDCVIWKKTKIKLGE